MTTTGVEMTITGVRAPRQDSTKWELPELTVCNDCHRLWGKGMKLLQAIVAAWVGTAGYANGEPPPGLPPIVPEGQTAADRALEAKCRVVAFEVTRAQFDALFTPHAQKTRWPRYEGSIPAGFNPAPWAVYSPASSTLVVKWPQEKIDELKTALRSVRTDRKSK